MATLTLNANFVMATDMPVGLGAGAKTVSTGGTPGDYIQFATGLQGLVLFGVFNDPGAGTNVSGTLTKVTLGGRGFARVEVSLNFQMSAAVYNLLDVNDDPGAFFAAILAGNDTLFGSRGTDGLLGHAGDDLLVGGRGPDTLDGGTGSNTAGYSTAAAGLTADLATPANNTGDAQGDIYIQIQNLAGSTFDDMLFGNNLANRLEGGTGNDLLTGRGGSDFLDGGAGGDTAAYDLAPTPLRVSLLRPATNSGDALGDTYKNIENIRGSKFSDHLTGNNLANIIWGSSVSDGTVVDRDFLFGLGGNDRLFGFGGNDDLTGGAGRDLLTGGFGADRFIYTRVTESPRNARDIILDFSRGERDKIVLTAIDARTDVSGNQAFKFIGKKAFSMTAGELRYYKSGSDSHILGDVNGDGVADIHIVSNNPVSFVRGDFVL